MSEQTYIDVFTCDGKVFQRLLAASLTWLEQNYETVNQLNVFPVPDGDTGTNKPLREDEKVFSVIVISSNQ